jgi:hypothetical protein
MSQEEKLALLEDIKHLINSTDEELIAINPAFLEYFTHEELQQLKSELIYKKHHFFENNQDWLDEIYEKTKKDEL